MRPNRDSFLGKDKKKVAAAAGGVCLISLSIFLVGKSRNLAALISFSLGVVGLAYGLDVPYYLSYQVFCPVYVVSSVVYYSLQLLFPAAKRFYFF